MQTSAPMNLLHALFKGCKHPVKASRVFAALARGFWLRVSCRVRGIRFTVGPNLRVYGKIVFRGPGRVNFGSNVVVDRIVTPWTYSSDALIDIGSNSYLNGTRFGSLQSIKIGPWAILGDASIMDTDFHSTHVNRHSPSAPVRSRPVTIEENVWIAAGAGLLPGTRIGRKSVVGFGAVCTREYPENSIIAGNPAQVVGRVPGAE